MCGVKYQSIGGLGVWGSLTKKGRKGTSWSDGCFVCWQGFGLHNCGHLPVTGDACWSDWAELPWCLPFTLKWEKPKIIERRARHGLMARCVKTSKGAKHKLWDLGRCIWVSIGHLFCVLNTFHKKIWGEMEKRTWIPLLGLIQMASKDPRSPCAHLCRLISSHTSLRISLHAVAPTTFFYSINSPCTSWGHRICLLWRLSCLFPPK